MRATVIITRRGQGYISTASGQHGGGHQGAKCGLTPHEAAAHAAALMLRYGANNPEGASLMAPDEVMALIPEHLRSIEPSAVPLRKDLLDLLRGEPANTGEEGVMSEIEQSIHQRMATLVAQIASEHGVVIKNATFEWINADGKGKYILAEVRLETTSGGMR